ncbi:EscU/YscU/HrcU family type III secretion system export apparatus switch protein [Bacillus horti]|uniref:Flagellar biosynthesis protein n=1 Tax=Caldalkalibacillus horti TaxID=77523 RepID=A0ABT9VUH0_9BACI|nr:EscU/YscU/HrcU family type III secretion system export apparatus switch protein [Bacillus horti]MDQ0164637.1 flagellar biosynthesis protein [Bacillus horti]
MNNRTEQYKKAVALHYQPDSSKAPMVKAKGNGLVAEEIIKLAKENGVPIQEDPALVQLLAQIEIDKEIPAELYGVVAEVMALVYRMEKKAAGWHD